jgi:nucleosome binding factor SPN SPT16 subunit
MATSSNISCRLLESVREELNKLLLSISGYEKVTVKSLEDACESIKDLFNQKLKQYMTTAKINSMESKDNLSGKYINNWSSFYKPL